MKLHSNYYIQTFGSPEQLALVFSSLVAAHGVDWAAGFDSVVVVDCSTSEAHIKENAQVCEANKATHVADKINYGISGGRQRIAELFLKSDAEYAYQQGDGLLWCEKGAGLDRVGFTSHVVGFFEQVKKIMSYERLDFLILTYMQEYASAGFYYPWHQLEVFERVESDFIFSPVGKGDCPRTVFENIGSIGGLAYATGNVPYTNWPSVWSRRFAGDIILNKYQGKPHEEKWMRMLHHRQREWNTAVVLASPLRYNHKYDYKRSLRREAR